MYLSPFVDNTSIQIRLLRNNHESKDDRIAIRRADETTYHLFYQDGLLKNKDKMYVCLLTGEELDIYLQSLFTLLVRDQDPFTQIQFLLPCFPTVLYDIQDLRQGKVRQALFDLLPLLQNTSRVC
jgi:hypothetical protein